MSVGNKENCGNKVVCAPWPVASARKSLGTVLLRGPDRLKNTTLITTQNPKCVVPVSRPKGTGPTGPTTTAAFHDFHCTITLLLKVFMSLRNELRTAEHCEREPSVSTR